MDDLFDQMADPMEALVRNARNAEAQSHPTAHISNMSSFGTEPNFDLLDQMADPMQALINNAKRAEQGSSTSAPHKDDDEVEVEEDSSYSDSQLAAQAAIATRVYETRECEIRKLREDVDKVQEKAAFHSKALRALSAVVGLAFPLGVVIGIKLAKKSS